MPDETDAKILTASPWWTGGDHLNTLVLRGWRLSSRTWNPITSPWVKQLAWVGQNRPLWRLMSTFGAMDGLLVMHARNEWMNDCCTSKESHVWACVQSHWSRCMISRCMIVTSWRIAAAWSCRRWHRRDEVLLLRVKCWLVWCVLKAVEINVALDGVRREVRWEHASLNTHLLHMSQ